MKKTKTVSDRKFHKRVITVTVLSEDELSDGAELDAVHEFITNGACSGEVSWGPDQTLDGGQMAKALKKQGSDPQFFHLNDDGSDAD